MRHSHLSTSIGIARTLSPVFVVLLLATPGNGAFTKIDDLESLVPGQPVNGQGDWHSELVNQFEPAGVSLDPADASNNVLRIGQGNYSGGRLGHRETTNTNSNLVIPNGAVATLFFRTKYGAQQMDFSVGMTDVANPISDTIFNSFSQFESQIGFSFTPGADGLDISDAGTARELTTQISKDTWYNVWMVIDNLSDTTQVYMQGGAFATQTLLTAGAQDKFRFRNSGIGPQSNDLLTFFIATGRNTSNQPPRPTEHVGPAFVDDLYIDRSGVNLTNPIPEPSTGVLAAVGLSALALLSRRGRRAARNAEAKAGVRFN